MRDTNLSLTLSPAPHIHDGSSPAKVNLMVLLALAPAVIFALYRFGMDAARVLALAGGSAMLFEYVIMKYIFRRDPEVEDFSALIVGILLAMLFPPQIPWWLILAGTFFAILVGRVIFGGRGTGPFSPALLGWAAIKLSWPDYLNFEMAMVNYEFSYPLKYPLSVLQDAGAGALSQFSLRDLVLGNQIGGIGAVPVYLLIIGGLFLIVRGVISWRIPFFFLAGAAITASAFWFADKTMYASPWFHLLTGNIVIGAFFLATDFSSSPVNRTAMAIFGFGCGLFAVILRVWSVYPDGVVFAILIMNILNPILDKIRPAVPGKKIEEAVA